jgi:hypothetical protein
MPRWFALLPLCFATQACDATTYCALVHSDTCVSSMPQGATPYPEVAYNPPPDPPPSDHHEAVTADTIVNVNGDHNVVNVYEGSSPTRSVQIWTPPPPPPPSSPRAFDPAAARESLHSVDLSSCRVDGGGGDGHAQITFARTGDVSAVVIDSPRGLGQQAVACIGSKLGSAHVPGFDGDPVTAGAAYRVP